MADALILTRPDLLPTGAVWGDHIGDEEALDWLTLVRLIGWEATVSDWAGQDLSSHTAGVLILTGDADALPAQQRARLEASASRRSALLVARAGAAEPVVRGRRVAWVGPGGSAQWDLRGELEAVRLEAEGSEVWATLDGQAVITARRVGDGGVIATTGVAPSAARSRFTATSALFKRLLTCGPVAPTAWLDLSGLLVLRMDDPGGAPAAHLDSWCYAKLQEPEWTSIGEVLQLRGARMTAAYTPGWLDDGERRRARIEVDGAEPARRGGAVHAVPELVHHDLGGNCPGRITDHRSEYRGMKRLVAQGLLGVEPHGYTHMHADGARWSRAPDRYENVDWYRELTPASDAFVAQRPANQHPVALGVGLVRRYFGHEPTTLVCPGQSWTAAALEHALEQGLRLVAAHGLALRDHERFCWSTGIRTVYLGEPDSAHLAGELPVVGHFHDLEPSRHGARWLAERLDAWLACGVRRFVDFSELSAALSLRLQLSAPRGDAGWRLAVSGDRGPGLPRPLPVLLHVPGGPPPEVELRLRGRPLLLPVQRLQNGLGRLVLPPGTSAISAETARSPLRSIAEQPTPARRVARRLSRAYGPRA